MDAINLTKDVAAKVWLKELAEEEIKHKHKKELYYDDIIFKEN